MLWIAASFLFLLLFLGFRKLFAGYQEKKERKGLESPIETQLFDALRETLPSQEVLEAANAKKRWGRPVDHFMDRKGYKVYTQIPVQRFRIDLALYFHGRKLAVECDGKAYHTAPDQVKHDRRKDRILQKHGWTVLRFTGSEIYRKPQDCVADIEKEAARLLRATSPWVWRLPLLVILAVVAFWFFR